MRNMFVIKDKKKAKMCLNVCRKYKGLNILQIVFIFDLIYLRQKKRISNGKICNLSTKINIRESGKTKKRNNLFEFNIYLHDVLGTNMMDFLVYARKNPLDIMLI